jgi:hypothetical protein
VADAGDGGAEVNPPAPPVAVEARSALVTPANPSALSR